MRMHNLNVLSNMYFLKGQIVMTVMFFRSNSFNKVQKGTIK